MSDAEDSFPHDMWSERFLIAVESVMLGWERLVHRLEPWQSMPLDDRSGELRRVLEELLDAGGGIGGPARRRRIRSVAIRHGAFRRAQRCAEGTLLNDFVVLRRALRRALRLRGVSRPIAREFAQGLLPDIRVAQRAARMAYRDVWPSI